MNDDGLARIFEAQQKVFAAYLALEKAKEAQKAAKEAHEDTMTELMEVISEVISEVKRGQPRLPFGADEAASLPPDTTISINGVPVPKGREEEAIGEALDRSTKAAQKRGRKPAAVGG